MCIPEWLRTTSTVANRAGSRWLVLWGLILGALCLRLFRLGFQPLWWDEGWSLYFATTDVRTLLELTAVDIHPPLYYLLLHFWIQLFGSGVYSVRLLSVLIGTATLPVLYLAGRKLLGDKVGLWAVFLLAISPFHIYYSQEVRMYALVTLLGLVACYFALQWDAGDRGVGTWLGYVLAAAAALYTQYYAAFLLLALNLVVLIRWWRGRRPFPELAAWLVAQAAVALLFLPWLWYAGGKLWTYVQFKVSVEKDPTLGLFAYLARQLAAFTWGHAEGALADWWWLGLLPPAVLAAALGFLFWKSSRKHSHREPTSLLLHPSAAILGVTLACGFVVNLVLPFNPPRSERLLLLALPSYLILVTAGLWQLRAERRPWAVVWAASFVLAAIVSLVFFYTTPRYPGDDYRPVAERVRALGLPNDAIICIHPWQVGYFHAYIPDDESRPTLVLTPREVIPRERQLWADEPARMVADLDALLAQHGRLWLLDHQTMGRALEKRIDAYLIEHAYPVLSEWYGENTVLSFFAAGEPAALPVTAQFGEWLTLERVALSPGPLEAGWGIEAVDLTWQLSEQPIADYTVGLRLVSPTGYVWAQRDAPPKGGLEPFSSWPVGEPGLDRHGLLVPAGTPPGDYHLTLQVYRSQDLSVLPVTSEGGSGGEVVLGTVRLVRPQIPPPLEALTIEQPLQADFGDRLRLLGYTPHELRVWPGDTVDIDLFWQALADPAEDFLPRLQLLDSSDQVLAELTEKPVAGTYPTAWWKAGELVRDPHGLPIPGTISPGDYRLALSLIRAADGRPIEVAQGQTAISLADIVVLARHHRYEPTEPQHVQVAPFGTSVELVGYDLEEGAGAPGSSLQVTLHWHALETPDRDYHTFAHLLDANERIVAQHDGPPAGGERPVQGWLPGEYLTDTHRLQLPTDLPDGEYRLGVGLYDPATGVRLGERLILDTPIAVHSLPVPKSLVPPISTPQSAAGHCGLLNANMERCNDAQQ